LAPDKQISDTELKAHLLTSLNIPDNQKRLNNSGQLTSGKLTINDVHKILAMNAAHMAEIADRTANNQSIVLKLYPKSAKSKKWSFLFTGDADTSSWKMINKQTTVKGLKSKVLKIPHHGSVNGIINESFLKVNPHYCIVSAGQKHGLPDASNLNMVKNKLSRKIFCTERNNNLNNPGPCTAKDNCPRKAINDFRSLRFRINTLTGKSEIEPFIFSADNRSIEFIKSETWCPENKW
jgi:hypothetical protein